MTPAQIKKMKSHLSMSKQHSEKASHHAKKAEEMAEMKVAPAKKVSKVAVAVKVKAAPKKRKMK